MSKVLQQISILALCALPAFSNAQNGTVQLSNESKLSINGKSNVNDFKCRSDHDLQKDSLQYSYRLMKKTIKVDGVTVSLEIDQFDCGKKGINRDFRRTLKHKEFPFIHITLNELELKEANDIVPAHALVTISIAGVNKEYSVPLDAFSNNEDRIQIGGHKILHMSDFGLKPPSPLFGLIQVSDELDIEFDLVIRL